MSKKFRTYELAKEFYLDCKKIKLNGAMKNQFERASLSIVLNLSEGSAKPTRKDRARFYFIAYGSLKETRTLLDLSGSHELDSKADKLGAYIWRLAHNPGGT
ncbi:MAG: hypothetical protein CME65_01870 [Halobacteriovoraceae bacterium]|nr:hypothetical protein [Halobacteriovoraceae bacterium]|tara:strand:+ start:1972 stop:2277 length:306 start_codon:yes stop_codon:yes gene_type:complete